MSEFDSGFFNAIKKQLIGSSIARAIVYTIGHIMIAASCYFLDKFWASKIKNS
jgi:hypothetical protein